MSLSSTEIILIDINCLPINFLHFNIPGVNILEVLSEVLLEIIVAAAVANLFDLFILLAGKEILEPNHLREHFPVEKIQVRTWYDNPQSIIKLIKNQFGVEDPIVHGAPFLLKNKVGICLSDRLHLWSPSILVSLQEYSDWNPSREEWIQNVKLKDHGREDRNLDFRFPFELTYEAQVFVAELLE
jgi:hypothetical protein